MMNSSVLFNFRLFSISYNYNTVIKMEIDKENIDKLSNEDLFKFSKQYGLNVGPITSTTRHLYEKRLKKHLESIENNSGQATAKQSPHKPQKFVEPNQKQQRNSSEQVQEQLKTNEPELIQSTLLAPKPSQQTFLNENREDAATKIPILRQELLMAQKTQRTEILDHESSSVKLTSNTETLMRAHLKESGDDRRQNQTGISITAYEHKFIQTNRKLPIGDRASLESRTEIPERLAPNRDQELPKSTENASPIEHHGSAILLKPSLQQVKDFSSNMNTITTSNVSVGLKDNLRTAALGNLDSIITNSEKRIEKSERSENNENKKSDISTFKLLPVALNSDVTGLRMRSRSGSQKRVSFNTQYQTIEKTTTTTNNNTPISMAPTIRARSAHIPNFYVPQTQEERNFTISAAATSERGGLQPQPSRGSTSLSANIATNSAFTLISPQQSVSFFSMPNIKAILLVMAATVIIYYLMTNFQPNQDNPIE
jgi:hypothetical protein